MPGYIQPWYAVFLARHFSVAYGLGGLFFRGPIVLAMPFAQQALPFQMMARYLIFKPIIFFDLPWGITRHCIAWVNGPGPFCFLFMFYTGHYFLPSDLPPRLLLTNALPWCVLVITLCCQFICRH